MLKHSNNRKVWVEFNLTSLLLPWPTHEIHRIILNMTLAKPSFTKDNGMLFTLYDLYLSLDVGLRLQYLIQNCGGYIILHFGLLALPFLCLFFGFLI